MELFVKLFWKLCDGNRNSPLAQPLPSPVCEFILAALCLCFLFRLERYHPVYMSLSSQSFEIGWKPVCCKCGLLMFAFRRRSVEHQRLGMLCLCLGAHACPLEELRCSDTQSGLGLVLSRVPMACCIFFLDKTFSCAVDTATEKFPGRFHVQTGRA